MSYKKISCSLYDRLESFSILKQKVFITFIENNVEKSITGIITDIYSKDNAEYLKIDNQIIRLDKIISINEKNNE